MENYNELLKDEIATLKKMVLMLEKRNETLEKEIEELKKAKNEKQIVEYHYYYHHDYAPHYWTNPYPYITCGSTNGNLNSNESITTSAVTMPNSFTKGTAFINTNTSTCSKC